ncbi:MAG: ATP-binding cassette domain-containing protein [Bacteroidetes bacterium]|nr:ATP-binding cassette domain-containing protein [Bacteroidota bacterium]
MSDRTLLHVVAAQVRYRGVPLFEDLHFTWKQGEHWAVFGDSGRALTGFLETLLGRTILQKGIVERPFATAYAQQKNKDGKVHAFRDLMALISQDYQIRNTSGLQNFYYQQRFNSAEVDDTLAVGAYLQKNSSSIPGPWTLEKVVLLLRLKHLINRSVLALSNGETRRLSLALGLLKQPRIYLMDQPLTGLDQESRDAFGDFLEECIHQGVHILLTTNSKEIPSQITQVARLEESGALSTWERKNYSFPISIGFNLPWDLSLLLHLLPAIPRPKGTVVDLDQVSIRYGDKLILDGLSWKVEAGEQWRLAGQNGSGKSTLISLLIGENPQAYSQKISLFGKRRGSGESIWDLKRPIGFVAPELGRFFPKNQSLQKVILSGFTDTMGLFRKAREEEKALANSWMNFFKLGHLAEVYFHDLTLAQQRWALLTRALIKNPQLLILDEASQGMDEQQRLLFRETVEAILLHSPMTLIYVSHYEQDVPSCINKYLKLG